MPLTRSDGSGTARRESSSLNPKGSRQTKKRRPPSRWRGRSRSTWTLSRRLLRRTEEHPVGVGGMAANSACPTRARRDEAHAPLDGAPAAPPRGVPDGQMEMMLGNRPSTRPAELYAPFDPSFWPMPVPRSRALFDEIETAAPGALRRTCAEDGVDGHSDGEAEKMDKIRGGKMVGVARIELATPAMSTQCSTTELHAHRSAPRKGSAACERCLVASFQAGRAAALEHAIDLQHQVVQVERLRQNLRLGRRRPP